MSAHLNDLVPELADAARALVAAAGHAGLQPRVTSTVRSRAEQTRLYRRSLQGLQPYYVAPPGSSAHEYGWAFDMVVAPFDALGDVGYTWQQWGGGWDASDPVHFELPGAAAQARKLGSAESPGGHVGETVRTWAEWFNDLPWYIQVVLPFSTMTSEKKITYADVQRVAARFGLHL